MRRRSSRARERVVTPPRPPPAAAAAASAAACWRHCFFACLAALRLSASVSLCVGSSARFLSWSWEPEEKRGQGVLAEAVCEGVDGH